MPGNRPERYTGSHFLVLFDGILEGPPASASFSEVSGLNVEVDVIEYRSAGEPGVYKLPGRVSYGNITLKRGVTRDLTLWNWMREIANGNVVRANGQIQLLDEKRQPVLTWRVRNAWPRKYEGPTLSASGNEVAIETLEICHEGLELEAL